MSDIIQIDVVDRKESHLNLNFHIVGLTEELTFSTYYFMFPSAGVRFDTYNDIKDCIADFIEHWVTQTENMNDGQTKHYPINLVDQWTGCLKVTKHDDKLEIEYGYSLREGWSVNANNPTDYFDSITDFKSSEDKTMFVSQEDFLASIRAQIQKLRTKNTK